MKLFARRVWRTRLWDSLSAAYTDKMTFKIPYMPDKMKTHKLKQGETIGARITILRSDLKELGFECSETSASTGT